MEELLPRSLTRASQRLAGVFGAQSHLGHQYAFVLAFFVSALPSRRVIAGLLPYAAHLLKSLVS
jgi:hypothetical protein